MMFNLTTKKNEKNLVRSGSYRMVTYFLIGEFLYNERFNYNFPYLLTLN